MKYGYFDDTNREYVITNPKTPVKWINYVGGLKFGGFVDQTGGSLICKEDPAENRITKYIPQLPASDFKGETVYIRLKDESGVKIFSPFYVPTLDDYDLYECHVGMGYSCYISEFYGIHTEITVFVPVNGDRVIRDIKITNLRKDEVEIDVIPVVEYTHYNALMQFTNADWVPQTMQSKCINEENGYKTLIQYAFLKKEFCVNYYTSNQVFSSYETDRKNFLGDNEYGTFRKPVSLLNDELSNYEALRGDNIAAMMHHLGMVKPNNTLRIITQLGQCWKIEHELPKINFYRDEMNIDQAFKELKEYYQTYLNQFQVHTPNESMNSMLNIFNPRQCHMTFNWSRYLSLYQLGLGTSRGIGFRDSSQDIMGVIGNCPEDAKGLIEKLLQVQKRNGSAMHQFNPMTMIANEGDSREMPDRPKYYGDDHLWIVLAVCAYLKETGDLDFLNKEIPYYEKGQDNKPLEVGTVLDHLKRSVQFTKNDKGRHGLPHLGFADWNDTVNLPIGAESIFNANLYGKALQELIELMTSIGDTELVNAYLADYEAMKNVVDEACWDGNWFIRYFDHQGNPIGSKENKHGSIYTNAQSWSVISGFASDEKSRKALDSVNQYLNTKNGIKLSYPGYNGFDPEKGGVTTYPPGAKENGGIFLHSNPWVMIAETILGNGNQAFEYYNQINPATKNDKLDDFECEPYVYPQNILGDEHPQFGLGRNSWLSGTASWSYQAATKYILGIRATYNGLIVDPCIPSIWDEFTVTKQFRNATYHIEVQNPSHVQKGIKQIIVDGEVLVGTVLPIFNDGLTHQVNVLMG